MTSAKSPPTAFQFKFLTRNLYVTNPSELPLKKICLQRVYLKRLKDDTPKGFSREEKSFRPFKSNKLLKTLKSAQFSTLYHPYITETLKTSKRLSSFQVNSSLDEEENVTNEILKCLKRLPNKMKNLNLNVEIGPPVLYGISRSLRLFPKLQSFSRWCNKMYFIDDGEEEHIYKELEIYKKSTSRRKISIFYAFGRNEISSFQRAVNNKGSYPQITGLEIKLRGSDFQGKNPSISSRSIQHQIRALSYRFEHFPNLKILEIMQEDALHSLGSFVFAALHKLEEFEIFIEERSMVAVNFFKGFLELPLLLKRFSLAINSIKDEEWILLQQFLKSHNLLETLLICVTDKPSDELDYKHRNIHLQNIIKSLAGKSFLKSLVLQPSFLSLESLSIGLSHLINLKNQLHTFKFQVVDDTVTSQNDSKARIDRLCEFVKNQKESLQVLQVAIPFVFEEEIINQIARAVSELLQLRILDIQIQNVSSKRTEEIQKYFDDFGQKNLPRKSLQQKISTEKPLWEPKIAQYLLRLQHLEDFHFRVGLPDSYEEKDYKWFLEIMQVLQRLEKLKNVLIVVDHGAKLKAIEKELCTAVLGLRNIREIYMNFWNESFVGVNSALPELCKTLEQVNERQWRYYIFF